MTTSHPIHSGQGEYVIFYPEQDVCHFGQGKSVVFHGEPKELTREVYDQAYAILNRHAPIRDPKADRYEVTRREIKTLDLSLEIAFIPKTLYELILLRKGIQEDIRHNNICPYMDRIPEWFENYEEMLKSTRLKRLERDCWHLGETIIDNEHPDVKDLAFRLNRAIVQEFAPKPEGFTFQKLQQLARREIQFLEDFHHRNLGLFSCAGGPTSCFGPDSYRGSAKPLGIRCDSDVQILLNAVALDCSEVAKKCFLIYRGTPNPNEFIYHRDNSTRPYSLSFGSSVFAGCCKDPGACAWKFIRNENNAYVIFIPFEELINSPFFYPDTNTLVQFFSRGEFFHPRTKAWIDFDLNDLSGINVGSGGQSRDHLQSHLTRDELILQFKTYMKTRALWLKFMDRRL